MKKRLLLRFFVFSLMFFFPLFKSSAQVETDSLVWQTAVKFTTAFNQGDTLSIQHMLPEAFMVQWMHENFLGKKYLLNTMQDTALRAQVMFTLLNDAQTMVRFSDDGNAACLNASVEFLNSEVKASIAKEHGFALCIMYFQKTAEQWRLSTMHIDLHCTLCNL
jgi:hypothetical protein